MIYICKGKYLPTVFSKTFRKYDISTFNFHRPFCEDIKGELCKIFDQRHWTKYATIRDPQYVFEYLENKVLNNYIKSWIVKRSDWLKDGSDTVKTFLKKWWIRRLRLIRIFFKNQAPVVLGLIFTWFHTKKGSNRKMKR